MILEKINLTTENQSVSLYKQVADMILREISAGTLKSGEMLPSSRIMAQKLGVSRKTVVTALDTLLFSGRLVAKDRVGIFVADEKTVSHSGQQNTSDDDKTLIEMRPKIVVNDGFPDTSLIPFREFSRAYRQTFNRLAQRQRLGYDSPMGYERLRMWLCGAFRHRIGLDLKPENVCIVRGSQMGLYLVANAILRPGDHVAIEHPGYHNAYRVFQQAGLVVHPIPVDREGLDVDALLDLCREVDMKAVYVTPRHQYPTTVTLSLRRRQVLRRLSEERGLLIVEDDFGSQFNYTTKQVLPLAAMLPKQNYVYIGTMSKVFAPGLRLGYVCSSEENARLIADYRSMIDIQGDAIAERAFFEICQDGELMRHIRRTTKVYKERLMHVSRLVRSRLGDNVAYRQPHGGLAIWLEFAPERIDRKALVRLFCERAIDIPLHDLCNGRLGIRIGYATMTDAELDAVISCVMAAIVERVKDRK